MIRLELFQKQLIDFLKVTDIETKLEKLCNIIPEIVNNEYYVALQKIKTIIENDSLSDYKCVQEIVCVFQNIGIDIENRKNFYNSIAYIKPPAN